MPVGYTLYSYWRQHEQQGTEIAKDLEWNLKTFLGWTKIYRITFLLYISTKSLGSQLNYIYIIMANANVDFQFLKTIYGQAQSKL